MCGPGAQKRYHLIPFAPKSMCTFVEFCLLTVKLQGPLAATKSDGFGKKLFASACPRHVFYIVFIIFPSSSTFHGVLCSNPPSSSPWAEARNYPFLRSPVPALLQRTRSHRSPKTPLGSHPGVHMLRPLIRQQSYPGGEAHLILVETDLVVESSIMRLH